MRLPNGEWTQAPRLQVHLGEWALQWHEKQKQTVATTALKLHRTHSRAGSSKPWVHSGRLETARRIEREVAPTAHQSGPEGLQSILESGQFQVSGTVYFRPLRPFDPDPTIPGTKEKSEGASGLGSDGKEDKNPDPKFMSEQQFNFDYPEDMEG